MDALSHVLENSIRRSEIDDGIGLREPMGRKRSGMLIVLRLDDFDAVAAFARDFLNQRAGFAVTEQKDLHLCL
jgi:hypothetical protein